MDTLDLVQLHCPPTAVYSNDAVYDALDTLVEEGAIAAYGVSVETATRPSTAIARPGVGHACRSSSTRSGSSRSTRCCRRRAEAGVGIIARVPLACGLLSGRYRRARRSRPTTTAATTGTARRSTWARPSRASTTRPASRAAREFAALAPEGATPAQAALAWIVAAARRDHRHPRGPLARAGPRQRRGRRRRARPPASPTPSARLYDEHFRADHPPPLVAET